MNIQTPTCNVVGSTVLSLRGGNITVDAGADLLLKASDNESFISCMHDGKNVAIHQKLTTVTTVTSASITDHRVITAAEMLGGLIILTPDAHYNVTTDTATNIVGAIDGCTVGQSFRYVMRNGSTSGGKTLTTVAGTGITLSGSAPTPINKSREWLVVVTNVGSPAVTLYSLGETVH